MRQNPVCRNSRISRRRVAGDDCGLSSWKLALKLLELGTPPVEGIAKLAEGAVAVREHDIGVVVILDQLRAEFVGFEYVVALLLNKILEDRMLGSVGLPLIP
jgi:hypothetical protein